MPLTDTTCPNCGTAIHSDDLWFGDETVCSLGCGKVVELEDND